MDITLGLPSFKSFSKLAFWALIAAAPMVSHATVIFSNFGAGFTYDSAEGNAVGNFFDGSNYAEADNFIAGGSFTFSSLEIALSCFDICPDSFTVLLASNSAGAPGSTLESFNVTGGGLQNLGDNNAPLTLTSVVKPLLSSGVEYWIVVKSDLNDSIAWNLNTTGDISSEGISSDGGASWFAPSGQTPGAYEVDGIGGSTTPEPGRFGMMLGGGLLLGLVRKFRK
jgi:hypothetical protein